MASRTVLLLLLVLACALPAAADAAVQQSTSGVGEIVVTWRGDPARGCAAQNVCDITGVIALTPRDDGGFVFESSGADDGARSATLALRSTGPRVVRGPADAPLGVCADTPSRVGIRIAADLEEATTDAPTVLARLVTEGESGLSAGRCAGPAERDLAVPLLPDVRVDRALLGRPRAEIDLGGRRTLAAGPYTIDVVSTLRMIVTNRTVADDDDDDEPRSIGVPDDEPRPRRRARLTLSYRAEGLTGSLTSRFTAVPVPGCELLDACGITGTQTVRARGGTGSVLQIDAIGPASLARGPRPVARMLAALRAGRLTIETNPVLEPGLPRADVMSEGGRGAAICRDQLVVPLLPPLVTGRRVTLGSPTSSFGAFSGLRTRCPGPVLTPTRGVIAAAPLDLRAFAAGRVTVRLRPAAGADPWPYSTRTDGAFVLRLQRVARPSVGTVRR